MLFNSERSNNKKGKKQKFQINMTGFKIPTWWEADQLATNMSQELELLGLVRNNSCLSSQRGT